MSENDMHHLFGSGGHLTDEGQALYVDALKLGRVDGLPPSVLSHVRECLACKHEITGLFALLAHEEYPRRMTHPYFDRNGRRPGPNRRLMVRMAAGLAALLGIGALSYVLFSLSSESPLSHPEPLVQTGPDTTRPAPPRGTPHNNSASNGNLAGRFEVSPQLEDLIQSTVRSGDSGSYTPINGSVVRHGDRFQWVTSAGPPFELSILDNHHRAVLSATIDSTAFTLQVSLQAGLYYWKLAAAGDLLHVGTFIVR